MTKIVDATLGVYKLKERHTAECMAKILKNYAMNEWKIQMKKSPVLLPMVHKT